MPIARPASRRPATFVLFLLLATVMVFPFMVSPNEANGQRRRGRLLRRAARRCPVNVAASAQAAQPAAAQWTNLFDGRTLEGWKSTNFGGEGEVQVVDGAILLPMGTPMTGVTWTGEAPPRTNYEIQIEAKRIEGIDFFCGLTFPVGDSYCSFIPSGWAGAVVGLSSIDGFDASDNETTQYYEFDDNKWYRFTVRVTPKKIVVWVDDDKIIDQNIEGRKISTRVEVDLSRPLGVSCYETTAAIRNIRIRKLGLPFVPIHSIGQRPIGANRP